MTKPRNPAFEPSVALSDSTPETKPLASSAATCRPGPGDGRLEVGCALAVRGHQQMEREAL